MRTVKRISALILCVALILAVLTVCVGCRKKTDVRMKIKCCEIQNGRRVLPFVDEVIFERDVDEMYIERAYDGKQYEYFLTGYEKPNPSTYRPWDSMPYEYHTSLWKEGEAKEAICENICERGDYLLTVYTYDELWGSRILRLHIKVI